MNILITGGGFHNKGAEAMVLTTIDEISKRLPAAQFWVECIAAEDSKVEAIGAHPFRRADKPWKERWERRSFRWRNRSRISKACVGIDAMLDVSGYAFKEGRATWRLRVIADSVKRTGGVVVFLPQSWGPATDSDARSAIEAVVQMADLAYARDAASLECFRSLGVCSASSVRQANDITFAFEAAGDQSARRVLESIGVVLEGPPLLLISPNQRVYERTPGDGLSNVYMGVLADLARFMLAKHDLRVLLLPHEILPDHVYDHDDDRALCRELLSAVSGVGKGNVFLLDNDLGARELKAVIGAGQMMVGSRFHGVLGAISQSIPVLAIGWAEKYTALLESVGMREWAYDCDKLDSQAILDAANSLWSQRQGFSESLRCAVQPFASRSLEVFDEVAERMR